MKYIYILFAGGYFKVGVAKHIEKRIKAIQTGCPFELILVASLQSDSAYQKEKSLHHEYRHYKTHGEWFLFSESIFSHIISNNGFKSFFKYNELIKDLKFHIDKTKYMDLENENSNLKIENFKLEYKLKEQDKKINNMQKYIDHQSFQKGYQSAIDALEAMRKYNKNI